MTGSQRWSGVLLVVVLILACSPGPEPSGTDLSPIALENDPEMFQIEPAETLKLLIGDLEVTISKKAEYVLRGIPVSIKGYAGDSWRGKFSPCDVAAVWGELVAGDTYKKLKWSQSGRWYFWHYGDDFGHDNTFVARYSSNNHMIPATENLRRALRRMKRLVPFEASGFLVGITARRGDNNYWWNSSMSLNDSGDGSCEVLYVTSLKFGGCLYR